MTDEGYVPSKSVALAVAPKIPALLSIAGSSYIAYSVMAEAAKRKKIYHRIMFCMSCCDIATSIFYFLGTWMVPKGTVGQFGPVHGASGNDATCNASGFFAQFSVASPLYNATLSMYYLLTVRYGWKESDIVKYEWVIHGVPLCFAFGTAIAGVPLQLYGNVEWLCWINPDPPQPHTKIYQWSFLFGPIFGIVAFISVVMLLLYRTFRVQEQALRRYDFERNIRRGNNTSQSETRGNRNRKRRKASTEIAIQGMLYVGAFYVTWFFPFLQRIIELTQTTRKNYFPIQFLDTFLLPLQGLLNAMVYLRPRFQGYRRKNPELNCFQICFRTTANRQNVDSSSPRSSTTGGNGPEEDNSEEEGECNRKRAEEEP